MGAKVTVFKNRSGVEMGIRVFIPPARPDQYQKIFSLKPDEVKGLKLRSLCCEDINVDNPMFLIIFMDGAYTGVQLHPFHVQKYTKIFGYLDESGDVSLKSLKLDSLAFSDSFIKFSLGQLHFDGNTREDGLKMFAIVPGRDLLKQLPCYCRRQSQEVSLFLMALSGCRKTKLEVIILLVSVVFALVLGLYLI